MFLFIREKGLKFDQCFSQKHIQRFPLFLSSHKEILLELIKRPNLARFVELKTKTTFLFSILKTASVKKKWEVIISK